MISGELSTSKAFAILLGAKSARRDPRKRRSSACNRVRLLLLRCGKGVREERWSAWWRSHAAKWEELTVIWSFCCSKAAANVAGVQRRRCRPLMLQCISHKCNLEIGFTHFFHCSSSGTALIRDLVLSCWRHYGAHVNSPSGRIYSKPRPKL